MVLVESESKAINITALVSKLNSNYNTVMRCLNYMKKLQIIEEEVIGRLRLIKLSDNELTKQMLKLTEKIREAYNSIS